MEAKSLCGRVNCPEYVTSVGTIESEMGYRTANPFTTHNLSLFYLFMIKKLHLKPLFKKGGGSESFNPGY
jgi:hypothetical protein